MVIGAVSPQGSDSDPAKLCDLKFTIKLLATPWYARRWKVPGRGSAVGQDRGWTSPWKKVHIWGIPDDTF